MALMYKLLCTALNTSIYRLPFPMIPPGYVLLGVVDAAKYSLAELRSDYRRGLVVAVSFCVFVMPVLLGTRYDHYITYVCNTHVTRSCRHYFRVLFIRNPFFSQS